MEARTAFSNDHDPVLPASVAHLIHSVGGLNNIHVLHPHSKLPEPAIESYVSGTSPPRYRSRVSGQQ